jgi:hypothetical protein
MVRFIALALLVPALAAFAAPVPSKRAAFAFALQEYAFSRPELLVP